MKDGCHLPGKKNQQSEKWDLNSEGHVQTSKNKIKHIFAGEHYEITRKDVIKCGYIPPRVVRGVEVTIYRKRGTRIHSDPYHQLCYAVDTKITYLE